MTFILRNSTIFLGPTFIVWSRICEFRFRKHSSEDSKILKSANHLLHIGLLSVKDQEYLMKEENCILDNKYETMGMNEFLI